MKLRQIIPGAQTPAMEATGQMQHKKAYRVLRDRVNRY